MKIGDLSRHCGLSIHSIRYYEKIGLLPPAHRDAGGRRQYSMEIAGWLSFLKSLKATGMGISDMVRYAQLREMGPQTARERRQMLERQRIKVLRQIDTLKATLPVLDTKIETYLDLEKASMMEADHEQQTNTIPLVGRAK
ncbi:MerR family transcriptional regulator [uncultured Cohaesibacter sp.]|uniref:MerR family transcriptional regulator n=1 Tax=uncultured Cohaesibacter sp. TaxID=1002546 RepID=UPI00292FE82E|nr:MerR family transcriptional regulator [uncultured Cohaesibacter sp.]